MAKQIASQKLIDAIRALGFDPNYVKWLELSIDNSIGPPRLTVHLWIDADRAAELLRGVDREDVTVIEQSEVKGDRLRVDDYRCPNPNCDVPWHLHTGAGHGDLTGERGRTDIS